jgi:protoporphyrinogen oxidase
MPSRTDVLIAGGGITGLSLASYLRNRDYVVLERDAIPGGYCKSTVRNGFVWDHSGHFFHFKHADIKDYVLEHMGCEVVTVNKISNIHYKGNVVDFPFQYNIHQLPSAEFIECLDDLYNCRDAGSDHTTFKSYVRSFLGTAICDKFIIPYNEKLYACDLDDLEYDSMGRFFPSSVKFADLLKHFRSGNAGGSYNDTFIYPVGGSVEFVKSIVKRLRPGTLLTNTELLHVDLDRKIARTSNGDIAFDTLVSTLPFRRALEIIPGTGSVQHPGDLSANKVVVFNLGFDRGTDIKANWTYFPGDEVFYRVGFYNNILAQDRMSLYIEIGMTRAAVVDEAALLAAVMSDLRRCGIVDGQQLIDHQCLVMDPAYVHITEKSKAIYKAWCDANNDKGIFSIGRYGSWTYCSIEDNIVQARALAQRISA